MSMSTGLGAMELRRTVGGVYDMSPLSLSSQFHVATESKFLPTRRQSLSLSQAAVPSRDLAECGN